MSGAGRITIGTLDVDRLGFGAMRITGDGIWGPPADPDGAVALLRRAVELGVDFIDTADAYGPDVSEELIARALAPYENVVVATKGGLTRSGPGAWHTNGRPEHLRAALEGSLRRLRVDRIDLYQFHRPDPEVPIEESLGVFVEAQQAGTIGNIGVSNVSLEQLERALAVADVVSVQNRHSVLEPDDAAVLEACEQRGIAFIPWFPLAAGRAGSATGALETVARAHGASTGQIALAWLLASSPVMVPIPGTSQIAHLEENVAAREIELTAAELDELNRAARAASPDR
jgi:aryl-alcohol dehydrogenase-like predicted oxidoreductase